MAGSAPGRTKDYRNLSVRDAILKAAEDICAEHGVEQVKVRELARAVGIKPASLYNHFGGREDVLAAVVRTALSDMLPVLEQAIKDEPYLAVEMVCCSYSGFFFHRPGITRLVLADFAQVRAPSFDANEDLLERLTSLEKQVYQRGCEQGVFRKVHLSDAVTARMGMTLIMLSARWLRGDVSEHETAGTVGLSVTEFMLRYLDAGRSRLPC